MLKYVIFCEEEKAYSRVRSACGYQKIPFISRKFVGEEDNKIEYYVLVEKVPRIWIRGDVTIHEIGNPIKGYGEDNGA